MLEKLLTPFHTLGALALTPFAAVLFYFVLRSPWVGLRIQGGRQQLLRALCLVCVGAAAFFVLADLATIPQQRPYQDDESAILSVSAAYVHGQPMYPNLDAPVEYSILYGPSTFLIYAVPALLHAESLMWFQAWVALGLTLALLFALFALRAKAGWTIALLAFGYTVCVFGMKAANEWSSKGDPWILFFVSLSFWGALCLRPRWADIWIALCGACLINLKATLLPLALLPLLLTWNRERVSFRRKVLAVGLMCLFACSFFLLPRISLANYRTELTLASRHGISRGLLWYNIIVFVRWFGLPLLAAYWYLRSGDRDAARQYLERRRSFLLLLLLSSLDLVVTGAKYGAGDWHLTPLALPFALVIAELAQQSPPAFPKSFARRLAPAIWIFGSLAIHGMERTADAVHTRSHNAFGALDYDYRALQREMLQVQAEHPHDTLQVGPSGGIQYTATWMRSLYILRGQPLFLDPNTRTERDASYIPVSPAVMQAVLNCRITLWLIPRGDLPFSMGSGYAVPQRGTVHPMADPHMYPEPFPSVFKAAYHRIGSTANFDLWQCNRATANP